MNAVKIEGKTPLNGSVTPSGSAISASKLIIASLYSGEEVILENIPKVGFTEDEVSLIQSLGGECFWLEGSKLRINTSGVNTHRIPYEIGSRNRSALLAAGPLLFRFGKAVIPKPVNTPQKASPIDRFILVWEDLGFKVSQDREWISIETSDEGSKDISFKSNTHSGTENAILSSLFIKGTTVINNAAEEPEVDDLISFVNLIGANVKRTESRRIEVTGGTIFKGGVFEVQRDKNEAIFFAVAGLLTKGSVTIKNVNKVSVSAFLSVLNKMGANFEFQGNDLSVWYGGETFVPVDVSSNPAPGFLTDWMPALCVLATQAQGVSVLSENIYSDVWGYIRDLNRMGARISILEGTPEKVSITGPTVFHPVTLDISDIRSGMALLLAALSSEGVVDIRGIEYLDAVFEDLVVKLQKLGAKISSCK
ncbi:UDP-N-acetylglucosamine 1-carboxyvinyltransferase [Patescibacteria group bacterium]|nr:UDP-N-acetylglucosamine 1-carboxyvinyltransferase [Patescibacteria group bacterium]